MDTRVSNSWRRRAALTPEQQHSIALIEWCALAGNRWPELNRLIHIPNEGKRSRMAGGILKKMGMKRGVPDYLLPVVRPYQGAWRSGLWIELKVDDNKPSEEQEEWLTWLGQAGYWSAVCQGWEAARDLILDYLGASEDSLPGVRWVQ